MPTYLHYRDDLEVIQPDETDTHAKIREVMAEGMNLVRKKEGKSVRVSHAKAHGVLQGVFVVPEGLPEELAQGLFSQPGSYPVVVRIATSPGEHTDDSKISTDRGCALKIFNVKGEKLPPFENITNQDFLLQTTKQFIASDAKSFLQSFKPNATIAPKLSDTTKGIVSDVARATNAALNAVGLNSEKAGFFGHPKCHPLAEEYFSQIAFRYGNYVAKFGLVPVTPGLEELENLPFDPQTPNALREATVEFFKTNSAVFDFVIQLSTDAEKMPVEDAQAVWSEEESPYRPVARLTIPAQDAYDQTTAATVENYSFSPLHSLVSFRPLGSVGRARTAVYTAIANKRRSENGQPNTEPALKNPVSN